MSWQASQFLVQLLAFPSSIINAFDACLTLSVLKMMTAFAAVFYAILLPLPRFMEKKWWGRERRAMISFPKPPLGTSATGSWAYSCVGSCLAVAAAKNCKGSACHVFVSVAFPSSLPNTDAKYSIWGKHMMVCQGCCSKVYFVLVLLVIASPVAMPYRITQRGLSF